MIITYLEEMNILDFEKQHNLTLRVNQLTASVFQTHLDSTEISERGMLFSISGYGQTVELAVKDYCEKISLKCLVIDAYTSERKAIFAPKLYYKEQ